MKRIEPKLSLVGAGPGDPELITLKGVKTLQSADVVLYDALANEALLDYAPETALRIYVGKRAGQHYQQQEEINKMIVGYAKTIGHVVRLKGGDPYIFGRGHEELEYAQAHGVPASYVPGISSSIAVPGLCGIPLTKRGINESFWVVTGTLKDGSLSHDLPLAAQSTATVVILMGLSKLQEITALFRKYRGTEEPIALIENGSLPQERLLVSGLGKVVELQEEKRIKAPAIIVIGEVIRAQSQSLSMLHEHLLRDARIGV
ncbi:uroporphyrinogen-III C-methyltransferase [Rhodonellum sp.]|uniref:uroporphyrinogen-III C-methyltransferase n=1 Tax=Rhodonellum sp. TaxID=2231180 RepID=UPI002727E8BB|nr:uroporphyrinogen-III C-methyltransferase [Rhodonellum sp.]MDO9553446.1 uroporphyrinogen-III C-methyltransferase [Rhodonellum sp.]